MTKEQFLDYLNNDLALEENEELIGDRYNSGDNSYFATRKTGEYEATRYNLYGISENGEEVWMVETTVNEVAQHGWPVNLY